MKQLNMLNKGCVGLKEERMTAQQQYSQNRAINNFSAFMIIICYFLND